MRPAKSAAPGIRIIRIVVIVIARSQIEEPRRHPDGCAIGIELQPPQPGIAVPIGRHHARAKLDFGANAAFIDDPVEIFQDRGAIRDRFFVAPRFEHKAQGVHIAVRADAGIAKQVPGSAKLRTAFEHGITLAGALRLHMRGHADAGNARTDNYQVKRRIRRCM